MKFCSHCGKEIVDEAVICPNCGCSVEENKPVEKKASNDSNVMEILIKVFACIGIASVGWSIIPLAWCIPMTVHIFKKFKAKEPFSLGFKICTLLFLSMVAGILLLVMPEDENK